MVACGATRIAGTGSIVGETDGAGMTPAVDVADTIGAAVGVGIGIVAAGLAIVGTALVGADGDGTLAVGIAAGIVAPVTVGATMTIGAGESVGTVVGTEVVGKVPAVGVGAAGAVAVLVLTVLAAPHAASTVKSMNATVKRANL